MVNYSVSDCLANVVSHANELSTSEGIRGSGFFDDQALFTELYKFLQALGKQAGYEIESVKDIREALSSGQLTKANVQAAYTQATGKHLDFHQISQRVARTMQIIDIVAQENYQMYQKLVGTSERYLEALNKARSETRDSDFRQTLDDLHREFEHVKSYIQFISQRQLKASYVPAAQDFTHDDQERKLYNALMHFQRVMRYCFAPDHVLTKKFIEKLKGYSSKFDSQVYMMRLIQKSPLVVQSTQYNPHQIVEAFERAYEQVHNIDSKGERAQYLAKLLKITQKLLAEKMTDRSFGSAEYVPAHRSIYQTLTHNAIVKDQRINVFKHRINHFYILIIKQFVQILDKKFYDQLAKMSQDLQLAVYELSEIQRELLDGTEQNINDVIRFLRAESNFSQMEYNNTIFRLKAVRDELDRRAKDLEGPFSSTVDKIVDLFANLIRYLDKTVKKGLYNTNDDLLDVEQYGLENVGDDTIRIQNQQNHEWLAFISNYLTVFHMRQNLARVKRELASIDENVYYQKNTYKQLQHMYASCEEFYGRVEDFYLKQSGSQPLRCDPALAKYLYHVALRFQSSMYISKGRSAHPALNPRYWLFSYEQDVADAQLDTKIAYNTLNAVVPVAALSLQDALDRIADITTQQHVAEFDGAALRKVFTTFYSSYKAWREMPRFIGLTEELAAHRMKHDQMSIPNDDYCLPTKPDSFKDIERAVDDTDRVQSTMYRNMKKNPFLHNIAPANPQLARFHFYQLVKDLYRIAPPAAAPDALTLELLGIDEFKFYPVFGLTEADIIVTLTVPGGTAPTVAEFTQKLSALKIEELLNKNVAWSPKYVSQEVRKLYLNVPDTQFDAARDAFVTQIFNIFDIAKDSDKFAGGANQKTFMDTTAVNAAIDAARLALREQFRGFILEDLDLKQPRSNIAQQLYDRFIQLALSEAPALVARALYPIANTADDARLGFALTGDIAGITYTGLDASGAAYRYKLNGDVRLTAAANNSNMYNVLQAERPSVLSQLLYVMNTTTKKNDDEIIRRVVSLMREQQQYESEDKCRDLVSCMSDSNLREYLLPQIQLPFINPSMTDAYIETGDMSSNQLFQISALPEQQAAYIQGLQAQYSRRLSDAMHILPGKTYTTGHQDGRRQLFDSMARDGQVKYTIGGKYSITPMFGKYLLMPILHHEQKIGVLCNANEQHIKHALAVKHEYDRVLNCFFNQADRGAARDYMTPVDQTVWASKRNAVYFAIDQGETQMFANQIDRQNAVYKSRTNAFFEYQLFMAQQLQYFTVHGCKFVFDPLVRKQIFEVATNIYRGIPVSKFDDNLIYDDAVGKQRFAEVTYHVTKPFGQLQPIQNPYLLGNVNPANPSTLPNGTAYPYSAVTKAPRGFYPITDVYVQNQPRLAIGVFLKDCESKDDVRQHFIDACIDADAKLIRGDILKVDTKNFDALIKVLVEDEDKRKAKGLKQVHRFRVYLSECIRLQYHANACVLERTEPINVVQDSAASYTLDEFTTLMKRVIRIKKRGYRALLQLAEQVDRMLSAEVKSSVQSNLKFTDLRQMLDKLMLHSRTDLKTSSLNDNIIKHCMNVNQYLSVYGQQNPFASVYKQHGKLAGKGPHFKTPALYRYDLQAYYKGITDYLDQMEKDVQQDVNIENFAKLFTHIYQHSDDEYVKKISTSEIRKFITQYMIASAIDVDTAVLETDFSIEAHKYAGQTQALELFKEAQANSPDRVVYDSSDEKKLHQQLTQFEFNTKTPMKLLGIDAIFIPQNWHVSGKYENTALVPREASLCTQELDFLYNNIMNAMAQKLINVLGLYRLQTHKERKKQESIVLPRILIGAGAGKRRKAKSVSREYSEYGSAIRNLNDFESRDMERYFRTFLLCKYYWQFFQEEISDAQSKAPGRVVSPVLMIIKPNIDKPEGQLLHFMFKEFDLGKGQVSFTTGKINELIDKVDKVSEHPQTVFEKIAEYVNTNYGIVSFKEYKQYADMDARFKSSTDGFQLEKVYNQIVGIPEPEYSNTLLKMETDDKEPVAYINTELLKDYLNRKIVQFAELLRSTHGADIDQFKAGTFTLSRMFRNLRLEYKNATRDQKVTKLRHMINDQNLAFRAETDSPVQLHERVIFFMEIIKQLDKLSHLYQEHLGLPPHIGPVAQNAHDGITETMLRAQLAHVFNHPGLIDVMPIARQIDGGRKVVRFRYDTKNIVLVLERLGHMIVNSITQNRKLADSIYVAIPGGSYPLFEDKPNQRVIDYINKTVTEIKARFENQEPFRERLTNEEEKEEEKKYQELQDTYYNSGVNASGKREIPFTPIELVTEQPFPGQFITKKSDTPYVIEQTPNEWSRVINGEEHVYSMDTQKQLTKSVAVPAGAPVKAAVKGGPPPAAKGGPGGLPIIKKINGFGGMGNPALKLQYTGAGSDGTLNALITSILAFNSANKYLGKNILQPTIADPISKSKSFITQTAADAKKFDAKGKVATNIEFLLDYAIDDTSSKSYACIWLKKSSVDWVDAGVRKDIKTSVNAFADLTANFQNTIIAQYNGEDYVALVNNVTNPPEPMKNVAKNKIQKYTYPVSDKGGQYPLLIPTNPIANILKYAAGTYLHAIVTPLKAFTNRTIAGGTKGGQYYKTMGLDQQIFTAYDHYPNATMQFNSIIKRLIQDTTVISTIPRAFAQLFQCIWSGQGSQQDYEMLIRYHDQHIRDYRSDPKYRIQSDNFINTPETFDVTVSGLQGQQILGSIVKASGFTVPGNNDPAPATPYNCNISNYSFTFDKGTMEGMISFDVITPVAPPGPDVVTTIRIPITQDIINNRTTVITVTDGGFTVRVSLKYTDITNKKLKTYNFGQSLVPGILYDGWQVGMQTYTAQEVMLHNDGIFKKPSQIRTHFTSSVLHFAAGLLKELHLLESEKRVLDAGKIPVLQRDTETQIAASCVYADMKLQALLESIDMRLRSLEMIDLYGLDQVERTKHLTALNEKISYYNSLKSTVLRFRSCVESFLSFKRDSIPAFLCDDKNSDQGLVSSFYRAIQMNGDDLCELDTMESIVYSRYISERMQKDGESVISSMLKQFGQNIDQVALYEAEPLIWMIMQAKQRLSISDIIEKGVLEEVKSAYDVELATITPSRYSKSNTIGSLYKLILEKAPAAAINNTFANLTSNLNLPEDDTDRQSVFDEILDKLQTIVLKSNIKFDIDNLPIQAMSEYANIQGTLPCRNPDIIRRITELITKNQSRTDDITKINLIDIGIVPINLNMLKKDVGLFHVFFNSTMYNQALKELPLSEPTIPKMPITADATKPLMGMKIEDMALIGASSFLRRHITEHLALLQQQQADHKGDLVVITKQDQFRYELHMRLALAMYALSQGMKPAVGEQFTPLNNPYV